MDKLLFEYQLDYKNAEKSFFNKLDYCKDMVSSGDLTLKEFLNLGFNNSYLLKKSDSEWSFNIGWKNSDKCISEYGQYSQDLSEDMMNIKVIGAGDPYEDLDGYYCMDIYCVNEKDYELFDKELDKDNLEL